MLFCSELGSGQAGCLPAVYLLISMMKDMKAPTNNKNIWTNGWTHSILGVKLQSEC